MSDITEQCNNTKMSWIDKLTLYSLYSLALFSFTSTSATALSHIFIAIPGCYYFFLQLKERVWQPSKSQLALLGLIAISSLSIILAPDISDTLYKLTKLKYFLLGFLSIFAYQALLPKLTTKQRRLLITLFAVTITLASISGIIGVFTGYNPLRFRAASENVRATGMYGMSITYGNGVMLPALIFSGALLWYQRFEEYINGKLLVAAWVSTLAGMVLSLTRGAILSYLLSAPILLWRYSKRVFWIAVGIVTIILVSIFITISTMNYSSNSTARLFQPINSTSNTVRISQYLAAWHAFIENPLTGVGFRNFEKHSCKIKKKHQLSHQDWCGHAHNNLLELLAGAGILGFLFLLLFHIFWFMESLARQDIWGPLLATSVAGFFLSGLFQSTIIDGENMFVVMFLYGIGQVQTRWSKSTT